MSLNTDALSKLDEGFDSAREVEQLDAEDALRLLAKSIRCASVAKEDVDAKDRIARVFCLGNEVLKQLDSDSDDSSIELPVEMLTAVRKDVEGDTSNVVPISAAMEAIGKRFAEVEPTQKSADDVVISKDATSYASGIDLNDENFDPNAVDWGTDPDFNA